MAGVTELMMEELPQDLFPQNVFPQGRSISYAQALDLWNRIKYTLETTQGFKLSECSLQATNRIQKKIRKNIVYAVVLAAATLVPGKMLYDYLTTQETLAETVKRTSPKPAPAPQEHLGICTMGVCKHTNIDGIVDEGFSIGQCVPGKEICDNLDNNCDGRIDDGFDLTRDPQNCGICGHACSGSQKCVNGTCTRAK
jgi:hypothetical protein